MQYTRKMSRIKVSGTRFLGYAKSCIRQDYIGNKTIRIELKILLCSRIKQQQLTWAILRERQVIYFIIEAKFLSLAQREKNIFEDQERDGLIDWLDWPYPWLAKKKTHCNRQGSSTIVETPRTATAFSLLNLALHTHAPSVTYYCKAAVKCSLFTFAVFHFDFKHREVHLKYILLFLMWRQRMPGFTN